MMPRRAVSSRAAGTPRAAPPSRFFPASASSAPIHGKGCHLAAPSAHSSLASSQGRGTERPGLRAGRGFDRAGASV